MHAGVMENGIPSSLRKEKWLEKSFQLPTIKMAIYATLRGVKAMWCSHDLKFRGSNKKHPSASSFLTL